MENKPLNLRLWLLGVGSPRLTESECAVGLFVSLRDRGFCALIYDSGGFGVLDFSKIVCLFNFCFLTSKRQVKKAITSW
ncbi:unnamed protein product [Prunus armeniaca]|uniref:Uncharacterized protein n=1 Tax=Prunus armeniaca TaxID=36596 RepID=A0A6J5V3J1_PRUAR|nr:unnamed protein product [Prunus armeniaca]